MNLKEAKAAAKNGKNVQASYYGPGWTMVYRNKEFYDLNPYTGSMLFHRFDKRDEEATWKVVEPKKLKKA